jgi:hypothetical protein
VRREEEDRGQRAEGSGSAAGIPEANSPDPGHQVARRPRIRVLAPESNSIVLATALPRVCFESLLLRLMPAPNRPCSALRLLRMEVRPWRWRRGFEDGDKRGGGGGAWQLGRRGDGTGTEVTREARRTEASGWNSGDAVMREIPQECSTADGNAHFADADANTAGGATVAVFSSFCRWTPGCRYRWSRS